MYSTLSSMICYTYLISYTSSSGELTPMATAKFSRENNGIEGSVMVVDGDVQIYLDISELDLTNVVDNCFDGGLTYHIHELWEYNDLNDRVGSECGRSFLGNHWDPWVACGPATDNDFCLSDTQSNVGCVPGSSVFNNGENGYDCNPYTFELNPYSCEVGDWSGKYGRLMVDDNGIIMSENSSPYEVSANDLKDLSVVFHCNDGSRVFCGAFNVQDTEGVRSIRPTQSSNFDLEANFYDLSDDSRVIFGNDGTVSIDLDIGDFDESTCPWGLAVAVYLEVPDGLLRRRMSSSTECEDLVGDFFDPTQSCRPGSDSNFCENDLLCGVGNQYSCNFDHPFERFSCAPGDITGKFGTFPPESDRAVLHANDPLLIDLSLAKGKFLVLQCSESLEILSCAKLMPIDPVVIESPTVEPTEETTGRDA